jgi:membrane-associated phospholipid phosphatase
MHIHSIRRFNVYFLLVIIFWLALVLNYFLFEKGALLVWINHFHRPVFDYFFYGITFLGDGIFATLLLVFCMLFINVRFSFIATFSFLSVVLVTQTIKHLVNAPRPALYFQNLEGLYYIDWIEIHRIHSFPSGHTAQAFSLALLFMYWFNKPSWSVGLFVLAALTGFSRMYLMQHFPEDVLVGSLIGTVVGLFTYQFLNSVWLPTTSNWNKPLISLKLKHHEKN